MISFNNALNIVSGFWHFLAPFINVAKDVIVNSFIFNDTGFFFVFVTPQEFIIKVLVTGLIIVLSSFIHGNLIIIRFDKVGTT